MVLSDTFQKVIRIIIYTNIVYIFVLSFLFLLWLYIFPKYYISKKIQSPKPISILTSQLKKELISTLSSLTVFTFLAFTVNNYLILYGYDFVGFGNKSGYGIGYYSGYGSMENSFGLVYQIFTLFLLFICHDTVFFWVHKFLHIPIIFKRIHKVHHQGSNINPLTSVSFHPVEATIQAFWFIPLVLILPISTNTFLVFGILEAIHTFYVHTGYEFCSKGFTQHWFFGNFATATHHNIHHQRITGHYALYFTWWDRLFSSEFEDYHDKFEKIIE